MTRNGGLSPLYVGAQNGHDAVVEALIAVGADLNKARDNGATPLYICAQKGHDAMVKSLITADADLNKGLEDGGTTPIWIGARTGHDEVVKSLIAAGADLNKANNNGATPLYVGAQRGHDAVVKSLIAACADLNKAQNDGVTPLFIGAQNGHDAVVKSLITAGADVNKAKNSGFTPLAKAAQMQHIRVVAMLLAASAIADTNLKLAYAAALFGEPGHKQLLMLSMLALHDAKHTAQRILSMIMSFITMLVTFLQLFSMPFNAAVYWTVSFKMPLRIASLLLFRFIDWGVPAWATMLTAAIIVSVLQALIGLSMLKRCYFEEAPFSTATVKVPWGTRLLICYGYLTVTLFFLPLLKILYTVFVCTHDDGAWTLDASNGLEACFTAAHVALMLWSALEVLVLVYWSFRLDGTNGSYKGVRYYLTDTSAPDDESMFITLSCMRRIVDWRPDGPRIPSYDWHALMRSPFVPLRVTAALKLSDMTLVVLLVAAERSPRVQIFASLAVSLLTVLLVLVYPHQYWHRATSIVYGASKFVLATSWAITAFVYEDQLRNEYTRVASGGPDGPTFIANGPVQFWHWLLLHIAAFFVGVVNMLAAMHWRRNPSKFPDEILRDLEAGAAAASDDDDDDATTATADDDVDAVDAVEMVAVSVVGSSQGASRRSRHTSRRRLSSSSSAVASLAAQSASPPSPRRAGQLSQRSADGSGSPRRRRRVSSRQDK